MVGADAAAAGDVDLQANAVTDLDLARVDRRMVDEDAAELLRRVGNVRA